ncbi:sigma-54-dependent transcriptional regulator [Desulfocurvibacter africanus]|uniref:sigma-54-dependent transcriptional regulator n=1 Tax=Desulfocurvibacter africanus TaxID=873 RepID=UPI0003FCD33B|nr:sigma-54 dependent transcriptional regulator [Desulfocurvibacter africanus]
MPAEPKPYDVLVVDDEKIVGESISAALADLCTISWAGSGESALELIEERHFDLIFLDISMPGLSGLEVLKRVKHLDYSINVVMISAIDRAHEAVEAMKLGAFDYLTKPFSKEDVVEITKRVAGKRVLDSSLSLRLDEFKGRSDYQSIITQAPEMLSVFSEVEKAAASSCSILITGESGTGKELLAALIHKRSPRAKGQMVAINCAAIPAELLESELFGHEKGSFTGAHSRKIGKFEFANKGTIFLDEVASLRIDLQAKLLRALQERKITRVGGHEDIPIDVRLVAATNERLESLIEAGKFRDDLYYRLSVVPIYLPPLRERSGDIPLLASHFLKIFATEHKKRFKLFTPSVISLLDRYPWPGNIRELRNFVERTVILAEDKEVVDEPDIPFNLLFPEVEEPERFHFEDRGLKLAMDAFERHYVMKYLKKCRWNQSEAARRMKIHRNTLVRRMRALSIRP